MHRAGCQFDAALGGSPADVEHWRGFWIQSHPAREALVEQARTHWRSRGFPFPAISKEQALSQALDLRRRIWTRTADTLIEGMDTSGLRLANSYHPQMWSIRAYGRNRSPIEYFQDDQFLARTLGRAPRFWPNRCCWSAPNVRNLFRIAAPGRVANFRPMVAAGIFRKFCPPGGRVVDFCSGYGGRLLAAIACGVAYVGIDAAAEQVGGCRQMADDLKEITSSPVVLSLGCATEMLERVESRSAELVFTSPPYFDKERYGDDALQSYMQFSSYRSWLVGFLAPAIRQSFGVLKTGGYLALNVADNRRFALAADTHAIMKKVFGNVDTYIMRMRRLPSYRHFGLAHRSEQILVSRKTRG
jgi:hypothetical protein